MRRRGRRRLAIMLGAVWLVLGAVGGAIAHTGGDGAPAAGTLGDVVAAIGADGRIGLDGTVPSAGVRDALAVAAARRTGDEARVRDALRINPAATRGPWLAAVTSALVALPAGAAGIDLHAAPGQLRVTGAVPDEAARDRLLRAVRGAIGDDVELRDELVVGDVPATPPATAPAAGSADAATAAEPAATTAAAPATPPATTAAAAAEIAVALEVDGDGNVALRGEVPTDDDREALVASALLLAGGEPERVDADGLEAAAPGVAGAWSGGVARAVAEIPPTVRPLALELAGSTLTVTGEAQDPAERDEALAAVRAGLGADVEVVDRIVVKPAAQAAVELQGRLDDALRGKVVEFQTASAALTPAGRSVLDGLLPAIRGSRLGIRIEGHTDGVGSAATNQELSRQRAEAVRAYLVAAGISRQRLATAGVGEARPIASNDTVEGRQRNRRIEFRALR